MAKGKDIVYNGDTLYSFSFYAMEVNMENNNKSRKPYEKKGNPFKRGKTWTYIYYLEDKETGKKIPKWKGGFASKAEAERALKETEAQILIGHYVADKKTKLADYLNHWFYEVHAPMLKAYTFNGYRNNIRNHIIPALGHIPLAELTRADIQKLYNNLLNEKKLSPTTVLYVHRVLKKALNEAVFDDLIVKNPCNGVKLPKKKKYRATVLSVDQMKEMLNAAIGSKCELEVLIAVTLGLRRGEILGLRYSDFNFTKKTLTISQQVTAVHNKEYQKAHPGVSMWGISDVKTDNGNREICVPQAVLDAVQKRQLFINEQMLKYRQDYKRYGLICCKPDGDIPSPQTMYDRFKEMLKTTNLPDMRFHDLRHSCATALLDMDVPLKVISQMLGHSSIKVTGDIYCDVIEKKRQPADLMQNAFFGSAQEA